MKSKMKKWTILSLIAATCLSCTWAALRLFASTNAVQTNAETIVEISSLEEFMQFRDSVNNGTDYEGRTVTLTTNVDLSTVEDWTPVGNGARDGSGYTGNAFKGIFDGGNYTVSNLTITSGESSSAIGLFGVVNGGTVKNLTLDNVTVRASSNKNAGAVIGLMVNSASADNIEVSSGSVSAADGAGGIVGRMTISGTISDCVNKANISGAAAGGIVGKAYYTGADLEMNIGNCSNDGTITSTAAGSAGGIVGFSAANVSGCINNGVITSSVGEGICLGGVVGWQQMYGEIKDNTNNGSVTTDMEATTAGGIVGWINYQYATDGTAAEYPRCEVVSVTGNTNEASVIAAQSTLGSGGIVGGVYNAVAMTENVNLAEKIVGGTFAAGVLGNYQKSDANGYNNESTLTVSGNVTTTATENITANCTNVICYDNVSSSDFTGTNVVAVAVAGDAYYATLQAAIDGAENGSTITVLNNVELTEMLTVSAGKTLTLDLNGYTLSVPETTGKHMYALNNKGELTLKDSAGGGKIEARGIYNGYDGNNTDKAVEGAKMTIESGAYVGLDSDGGAGVFNCADLVINGGTFEGSVAAVNSRVEGTLTVNGGTFNGGVNGYTVQTRSRTTVFHNATINGVFGAIGVWGGEVTINGGTYTFTGVEGSTSNLIYTGAGSVTINGGQFSKVGDVDLNSEGAFTVNSSAGASVAITGGSFSSVYENNASGSNNGMFSGTGALKVEGGTYTTPSGEAAGVADKVSDGYALKADGTVAVAVAQIGEKSYADLQEAIDGAENGDTIALLKDVELSELIKVTGKSLTLEGNGNSISGEGALWLLSDVYEIKNVVFEDITYMDGYGVLEFTYATATVENCVFKNNNVKNVIAVDCNANNDGNSAVTMDGCTFTGNTCSTSVINSAEGTTVVKNSAITANVAEIAVMYNSANCNVTGCYFKDNTLNGTNANKAVILTGPWVNGEYTIRITENAFVGDTYVAVYVEDWSKEYGASSSNDLNDNYWNGGKPNYVAENPAAVSLNTCYTEVTYVDGEVVLSEQIAVHSALGTIGIIRNIATTNAAGEARYQAVFLCGIDALTYKEVGFEITVDGVTRTLETSTVYTGYIAAGVSHEPSDFGTTSTYIFAIAINFPTEYANEAVTVRAFYESFDGSRTYGETKAWDYIYQE